MKRLSVGLLPHRLATAQMVLLLVCSFMIFTGQASAVIRFQNRSLFVLDPTPGVTTRYTVSLTYNNQAVPSTTVGSLDLLFCNDPIPTDPCDPPAGLNVSNAVLSDQTGITGFTILNSASSANHLVLTRTPGTVTETPSTYVFDNMVNPADTYNSFSIRLSSYSSTDATGTVLNLGSVLSQVQTGVTIETQVPPILVFCVAHTVDIDCSHTDDINYTDLGEVDPTTPLTTTSQMSAGTNASGGYVITANGTTMEAGSHEISALASPTLSAPGNSQFGINLVANTSPNVGADTDGDTTAINAIVMPNYATANEFKYADGDAVASAPNVSFMRRYTVSYIVNVPPDLHAGVYTTTITYVCSGRF